MPLDTVAIVVYNSVIGHVIEQHFVSLLLNDLLQIASFHMP